MVKVKLKRRRLCDCDCGGFARFGKRYIYGHSGKGNLPIIPWNKGLTKDDDSRLIGHISWNKGLTKDTDVRLRSTSEKLKGREPWSKGLTKNIDERVRKMGRKVSIANKGNPKIIRAQKEKWGSLKYRKKVSEAVSKANKGCTPWNKGLTKETSKCVRKMSKKISKSNKGRTGWNKGLTKEFDERVKNQSEKMCRKWQEPNFIRRQMKSRGVKPNKLEKKFEKLLNILYPREWKYVGDGQLIIGGKCPDFVNVNSQKKLIELYGDYWHRGQDPEKRKRLFRKFGYETLVLWEKELKNINDIKNRLEKFMWCNQGCINNIASEEIVTYIDKTIQEG